MPKQPTPAISVIVPAYNVGKYIGKALDSIHNQTFTDWECIVVDDGSEDNTLEIAKDFQKRDPRFKVIHKENGGVSSARNKAMEAASGKYIAFVDPDDWAEPNFLQTLFTLITKEKADVAQISFIKEYRGFSRKKLLTKTERIIEGEEIVKELMADKTVPSFLWNKIFRSGVLGKDFPEGKVYEDFFALTSRASEIKRIVISPYIGYHYRMRKGSITAIRNSVNQTFFLEAIKQRGLLAHRLIPDYFDEDRLNLYLISNLMKRAKQIARTEPDTHLRKKSVEIMSHELRNLKFPQKLKVSKKIVKRAMLLRDDPESFIKTMRNSYLLDFHTRYCNTRMYE